MSELPVNSLAGRTHNQPPLAELLAEELAPLKARTEELLNSATFAGWSSAEDAARIVDLIALIRAHEKALDRAREERKAPQLAVVRTIDAAFGALAGPLARTRTDLTDTLGGWLDDHPDAEIHPSLAQLGSRREIVFVIEDLPALVAWLMQEHPGEIAQLARVVVASQLRGLGVDVVAVAGSNIPGVSAKVESKVQVR